MERAIASRPSMEQVVAIVDFMEQHPALALGQLRGLEGRHESKKLWSKLTRTVNCISGPTRPMKSWVKYWADKKSTIRTKVTSCRGDPSTVLGSNIEKKIWDLFLANDSGKPRNTSTVKQEVDRQEASDSLYLEDSIDQTPATPIPEDITFEDVSPPSPEDRQMALMDKLMKVMTDQATAMAQLAQATHVNAQAMERLADASQIQARAIDRLPFESIGGATHEVRNAIVDIDVTMKRYYNTSPT